MKFFCAIIKQFAWENATVPTRKQHAAKFYLQRILCCFLILILCGILYIQIIHLIGVPKNSALHFPDKISHILWLNQRWDDVIFTGNKGDVWKWQINWGIIGKLSNDTLFDLWKVYPYGNEFLALHHDDQSYQFTGRYWLRFQLHLLFEFRSDPRGFYSPELNEMSKYLCKYWNEIQYAEELNEIDEIVFSRGIDPSVSSVNVNPNLLLNTSKTFVGLKHLQVAISVVDVSRSGSLDNINLWVHSCSINNPPDDWPIIPVLK